MISLLVLLVLGDINGHAVGNDWETNLKELVAPRISVSIVHKV